MPMPPRMVVLPLLPGDHTNPPRGAVRVVRGDGLGFVAHARIERQVGVEDPVVLHEKCGLDVRQIEGLATR